MNFINSTLLILLLGFLISCQTSDTIRYKDSTKGEDWSPSESLVEVIPNAHIVHVDTSQRIATIRSSESLSEGYYSSLSQSNREESAVLKLVNSTGGLLYIADILEGSPKINDLLIKASQERTKELDSRYTEATVD
ncbi:MAG: hypothetical protein CML12_03425 [Puniceicoccaceae bacterium]|nr:hypothetical protein [Puniceicoccaceae bacterium]RCL30542.1 MAG: hypothetical protein DBX03_02170 [Puniceicoccaceae bacterium]